MLAPRSLRYIIPFYIFYTILTVISFIYWWVAPFALIVLIIGVFMTYFFRDPPRDIIKNDSAILAPADGTIIQISRDNENAPFLVKIRMSPFDVHINRAPFSGTLETVERISGKHVPVYLGTPAETNEKAIQTYVSSLGKIKIVQITGAFARRIEVWVEEGQFVEQGEKIGMIRFGSETDLYIYSSKKIKPIVKIGEHVKAGITIVGRIL